MLQYEFMQKAFLVGIALSIIIPCIGSYVVLKRLSMIGDALSHASLSGVAIGLIFNFNPLIGAFVVCIIASLTTTFFRNKMPHYSELSVAIITSFSVGLVAILTSFIKNVTSFNSFLFGSIVAISTTEVYSIMILSIIVILIFLALYKELMYISFDEYGAKVLKIRTNLINITMSIVIAVTVALASRTVGALMISSFIVLPIASSMQISRSYKSTILIAILFALIATICGLTLAFYFGLKPGGTITLISVTIFILCILLKTTLKSR